jgi:hypothetical protein
MTQPRMIKELRFLKLYTLFSTLALAFLLFSAFSSQDNAQSFGEIDVERINIVEKDGTLRMVISNQERQHPGIVNGKLIERTHPRPPGMIFFNHLGDEMGGLVFGDNGGKGHWGQLSFDKVLNDQTIGFRHLEGDNGKYASALVVWQQPDIPGDVVQEKYEAARSLPDKEARNAAIQAMRDNNELSAERLFVGKGRNDASLLIMSDIKGRPRIVMQVAADGAARLDFLDEDGNVVNSLP